MKYLEEGFSKVYEQDLDSQKHFLGLVASEFRNCDVDILLNSNAVFVPNNDYMSLYFGKESKIWDYTESGECIWNQSVIFPIRDVLDNIVGINAYFPFNKLRLEAGETLNKYKMKYKVSNKSLLNTSLYFFAPKGVQRKVLEDGYVILTDGTFDTLALNHLGLNAMAFLGSSVSKQQIAFLSLIDKVYLAMDNDSAGVMLLKTLRRYIKNVRGIRFGKYKDIDDVLKSEHRNYFLDVLYREIERDLPSDIVVHFYE